MSVTAVSRCLRYSAGLVLTALVLMLTGRTADAQGMGGSLPQPEAERRRENPPATTSSTPTDLEAQIESLERLLASAKDVTITTIEPLPDIAGVRQRAAEYRARVNQMRRLLYLPDPKPDSRVAGALKTFQSKWGDLVRPLLSGEIPDRPLEAERWARHVRDLSSPDKRAIQHCADRVPLLAPPTGMPLVGWAWTCLSDQFFYELAEIEVGVNSALTARRRQITQPLESDMRAIEERLASVSDDMSEVPSPRLFLREMTMLLFKVWQRAVALRIRELDMQRSSPGVTPAFRWLLEMSPVVHRPEAAGRSVIRAPSGTTVTATLDAASAEATVVDPVPHVGLARELHRIHYRLSSLPSDEPTETRTDLEAERAKQLTAIAASAR